MKIHTKEHASLIKTFITDSRIHALRIKTEDDDDQDSKYVEAESVANVEDVEIIEGEEVELFEVTYKSLGMFKRGGNVKIIEPKKPRRKKWGRSKKPKA